MVSENWFVKTVQKIDHSFDIVVFPSFLVPSAIEPLSTPNDSISFFFVPHFPIALANPSRRMPRVQSAAADLFARGLAELRQDLARLEEAVEMKNFEEVRWCPIPPGTPLGDREGSKPEGRHAVGGGEGGG